MPMIGFTVTPGVSMSMRRNEIPCCFLTLGSVCTKQKILSAQCAKDIQVFCPLTT